MKTVRIDDDIHKEIVQIAAERTIAQHGRKCDLKGAVRFLVEEHKERRE